MEKYHFRINNSLKYKNAGSKAVDDCRKILLMNGYKDLEIHFNRSFFLLPFNFIKLLFFLIKYLFIIKNNSLVFTQYPILGINSGFKYYARLLKLKRCKIACIIHDLEAIRSENPSNKNTVKEIEALSAYDAVIAHNNCMREWLLKNGYKGFITEIILFDYLMDNTYIKTNTTKKYNNENVTITFAGSLGNLGRSTFLSKLVKAKNNFSLNLYGSGYKEIIQNEKIKWYGSFSPEDIVDKLEGDFGLIWDGDSLDDISGLMGNYLRYNTPHKTSLYLVSGLPVIISENAAIANFVLENNIGICISGIASVSQKTTRIKSDDYFEMKKNTHLIKHKLVNGEYFTAVLKKVENYF